MKRPDNIEAIFFDMGGTLRTFVPDAKLHRSGLTALVKQLGVQEPPEVFLRRLLERARAYRQWADAALLEASEVEIWTRWMLPDRPPEQIASMASRLTHLWRETQGRRVVRPDARRVIAELAKRGYRLGVISNTISPSIVPRALEAYGLTNYFPVVILSSTFGRRKPDPTIFLEAARSLGVNPARSAYVGDQIARDVVGARRAGFGMAILIGDPNELPENMAALSSQPDAIVRTLSELLDIFLKVS